VGPSSPRSAQVQCRLRPAPRSLAQHT
jgi:hypothetical protein